MNVRHVAAAVLTAGALTVSATPASATCTIANIEICDKPTDPYTDPVIRYVLDHPGLDPVWPYVGAASQALADAYKVALCLVFDSWYC